MRLYEKHREVDVVPLIKHCELCSWSMELLYDQ